MKEGLHRPIVSPSTHKGRRRQGIISLVCQELWLPAEGQSESTNNCTGWSCQGKWRVLMAEESRRHPEWTSGQEDWGEEGVSVAAHQRFDSLLVDIVL